MHFKMTRVNVNILFTQIIFHHFKVASLKCISVHSIKNMSNHDEFPITFVLRLTGCVRVSLFPLNLPQHISTLVKYTLKWFSL